MVPSKSVKKMYFGEEAMAGRVEVDPIVKEMVGDCLDPGDGCVNVEL